MSSQTCDWPHTADCAGHYHEPGGEPVHDHSGSEHSASAPASASASASVGDAHEGHYDNLAPPSHLEQGKDYSIGFYKKHKYWWFLHDFFFPLQRPFCCLRSFGGVHQARAAIVFVLVKDQL